MKTFLILVSFFFLTNADVVHQDTPLQIDKNGDIIGLPNKYSPAKFDKSEKILRIGNRILVFPECITEYFEEHKNPKLRVSASWYHSKDIMPYYLNFDISDDETNFSYNILIDLETLELIYVNKEMQNGNSYHNKELELSEDCLTEYNNGIRITY
ncbi:MAG: hypothetical protein ABJ218_13930 [Winogradskyella arenosi]